MLKIAVCDDNKQEVSHVSNLLRNYQEERNIKIVCDTFCNGVDLIDAIRGRDYDLILLDVIMKGLDGLQTAGEIRNFNRNIRIIFLSVSPEYALDSYSVEALGYLLKPAAKVDLFSLLDKVSYQIDEQNTNSLLLKNKDGIIHISLIKIEYVEVLNKKVSFHLSDGTTIEVSGSLSDYEPQLLENPEFVKIHRSYLLNLRYIQTLTSKGITTYTGHLIPVSKKLYSQVKETYMHYLFVSKDNTSQSQPLSVEEQSSNSYKILLVDDEPEQLQYWSTILENKGCLVHTSNSTSQVEPLLNSLKFDCIILDVMLSGISSFSYCRHLQKLTTTPIIFLSSLSDSDSQLEAFSSGGLDYITKDTPPELFWTKIEARIRVSHSTKTLLSYHPLIINLATRKVYIDKTELLLTPTEFDLLWLLADHPHRIFTPKDLYHAVWGLEDQEEGQIIQVHLSRLRRKLEKACPQHFFIETIWGKGYHFLPAAQENSTHPNGET